MAEYAFLTTWLLESPRQPVWEALHDQARWRSWWRGVEAAEERSRPPGGEDVGTVARMVWKSLLPYRVEFEGTTTRVQRPSLLEGRVGGAARAAPARARPGGGRDGRARGNRPLAALRAGWRHRRSLRVEREHDQALDEPAGTALPAGLRAEAR